MESLPINQELYGSLMQFIRERGYSRRTIEAYRGNLRRLLKGNDTLDQAICLKYLRKYKQPNQRIVVKIINEYCSQNNIDFNVTVPRIKQKPRKIPEILSIEEIKIIVNAAPKPYDLMLRCIFGVGAGLRISEVIKITWNNIRWAEWINGLTYGVAVLRDTKRSEDRVVNIPNELMKDLYALAKEKGILNEHGIPVGSLIFGMGDSIFKPKLQAVDLEQWKHEYVKSSYNYFRYHVLQKHCEPALNKKIHAHQLRHSRATYLYEVEKLPIERIQQLLGHKDIKTTMIYTRIDPKTTFEMVKDTKVV